MRLITFARRNTFEILRDPINLFTGLGFPLVLLFLLSAIQANVPVPLFEIESLTPGICVFGLSFMSLFSATLIAKDRQSAFILRLYTTPLTPTEFIFGYTLPLIPISLAQCCITLAFAMILGLDFGLNLLWLLLFMIPISLLYIAIGLLCGTALNDKQVGGICGALLTNLSAWLSGTWFDLDLVGGTFKQIAQCLPFYHAVSLEKAVLFGEYSSVFPHLLWVLSYAALLLVGAVLLFLSKMKKN